MHELAVCQSLIDEVERVSAGRDGARAVRIELAVGPLSGVEPHLLQAAFAMARAGTVAEAAMLAIETTPVRIGCLSCGWEGDVAANALVCRQCRAWQVELRSGDELVLKRVTLERDETEGCGSCARTAAAV